MRILLVDQFGEIGGAQRCLVEAAQGFTQRGWKVAALVPAGPLVEALAPFCEDIRTIPCGPFHAGTKTVADGARFAAQLPVQATRIKHSSKAFAADAIYVNGPRLLPAVALAQPRAHVVHHVHWMVPQRTAAALARWALRRMNASAISSSHLATRWLQASVHPDHARVVYNGVAGVGTPLERTAVRHVAVLGRVSPEKGQLTFVRAARSARKELPDVRFAIAGAPLFSNGSYWNLVRAEAGDSVEFDGWVQDVPRYLAGIDLLVVPSEPIDNIPRVILEAFACRVPVLAFNSGAIPEIVRHNETGLLVRDRTPEALGAVIVAASRNHRLLRNISERAYREWQDRYTLRRFQGELCEAVEALAWPKASRTPLAKAGASALK
jgi:glycosyltransferase involved in cell wall biosynthesis